MLARRLARGEDVSAGEVGWYRGWHACMDTLLSHPKDAAAEQHKRTERK